MVNADPFTTPWLTLFTMSRPRPVAVAGNTRSDRLPSCLFGLETCAAQRCTEALEVGFPGQRPVLSQHVQLVQRPVEQIELELQRRMARLGQGRTQVISMARSRRATW